MYFNKNIVDVIKILFVLMLMCNDVYFGKVFKMWILYGKIF